MSVSEGVGSLPPEILERILLYVIDDKNSFATVRQICCLWNDIICNWEFRFYQDGSRRSRVRIAVDDQSEKPERTGEWVSWHSNGQLWQHGHYANGQRTGLWCQWNLDLTRLPLRCHSLCKTTYLGGLRHGPYSRWVRPQVLTESLVFDGDLICELRGGFCKHRTHGEWIRYWPNGKRRSTGAYDEEGKRHGVWLFDYISGARMAYTKYFHGLSDGDWCYYYENERVRKRQFWRRNERVGVWMRYAHTGICFEQKIYEL